MMIPKPAKPFRSKKYLAWVARLPCCVTHQTDGVQAHHLLRTPEKAMGRRSGDNYAIPLHHAEHTALHRDGNEGEWLRLRGIDGPELARRLVMAYPDHEQAVRIVCRPQAAE